MGIESRSIPTKVYRLSRFTLYCGIACLALFGLLGVASFVDPSLLDPYGQNPNRVVTAVVVGVFFGSFCLLGGWVILEYFRHRLCVSSEAVQLTGCFRSRTVRFVDVTRAVWHSPACGCGSLILHHQNGAVRLSFGHYKSVDRLEMIAHLRAALGEAVQEGWGDFESHCQPVRIDYEAVRATINRTWRLSTIGGAIALPVVYAVLIWRQVLGDPILNWALVTILPLAVLGGFLAVVWLFGRWELARVRRQQIQ